LGAFLSGGIDSSLVVGLMCSMLSQPVKTFSIGFEEDEYSELSYARQVAQYFGTDHHEFFVRPDLISVLPQLVWAYDEPFADASMLPTYYVSKLARQHVSVVLTGDGGDEVFGGYTRYESHLALERIPAPIRSLLGYGGTLMPTGMRGKNRLRTMAGPIARRYVQGNTFFSADSRRLLYQHNYLALIQDHNPYMRQVSRFASAPQGDIIAQMQYVDVQTYLVDDILVKVDKASMFNSLETRAPLLDQHVAEYVASLPPAIRTHDNMLKYLLKKVAADLLPYEILVRPKQGFGVPIKHWFRDELTGYAHDLLESSRARQRGIFNQRFIHHLLQAHSSTKLVNHAEAIWALLCLELWFQTYMDKSAVPERHLASVTTHL
jgi:asparagine synthase (glutamine-hydrolysing)